MTGPGDRVTEGAGETGAGVMAALLAFGSWALLPLYFNLLRPEVSAWEITPHRILWACLILTAVLLVTAGRASLRAPFRQPRLWVGLVASATLIAGNWGIFIWAVTHGHVLQSSLGYYINPLVNVLLGFCFLGERLRPLQSVAVAIAATGVAISVLAFGEVPWLSLGLAGCFGAYGLIRKQLPVGSLQGLWVETLLLTPVALGWLAVLYARGDAAFAVVSLRLDALLIASGAVTIVPLVCFTFAARRLRLGTLGLFQYITPTGHFLTGVFVLGEPFTRADLVTFGCIWLGLALYSGDLWRQQSRLGRSGSAV